MQVTAIYNGSALRGLHLQHFKGFTMSNKVTDTIINMLALVALLVIWLTA
jgi:hypothetical protein